ncbi:helix-turn-helix domain-containing protein [Paraburkholderia sp. DHOC27]|uniref:helix-turn-helix domain-containing protein n=1 Tax=Paraburkholderia sp. DHOC27 TaxID=2303330 RepID=UPI0015F30788|nr:AraC family transcriptional regulator [Paraburkholderia sp. DHOC27]
MQESLVIGRYTEPASAAAHPGPALSESAAAATASDSSVVSGAQQPMRAPGLNWHFSGEDRVRAEMISVSRWASEAPRSWDARIEQEQILVALCLRQSLVTLSANGEAFFDGIIDRGAALVVPSGFAIGGAFQTPTDFLHIHVPSHWLTEWLDQGDVTGITALLSAAPLHVRDSVVTKLTATLLRTVHGRTSTSSMYADGITLSILARVLEIMASRANVKPARVSSVSPLEAWRVKLAVEFIDQRIDQSLTLAELGAAVGLSPMHFAARFRAATGISPHTFVLRRRIEHAQTLLATTTSTVADIAFSVGFRTQAHFTTVFRRHVDDTPHRWRAKHATTRSMPGRRMSRADVSLPDSYSVSPWKSDTSSFSL